MTATIYNFSEYAKPKATQPKKVSKADKCKFVIYNSKVKCYFVEEESRGVFKWSPIYSEALRYTKEQSLLMKARLKFWYPDQSITVRAVVEELNETEQSERS